MVMIKSAASIAAACCCAILALCILMGGAAAEQPTVVSAKCDSRGMIPQGSQFWGHLGYLLQVLSDHTPYQSNYHFKTRVGEEEDAPAFGEAYCQASHPASKCRACLRRLSSDIWRICNSAIGARVEYPVCWIRYEDYSF
ncbi:hypothetical protein L7F22_042605 [Adiantum nelumboides]|nr:hypothetical protein [Adiantum nelumboides]